MNDFYIMSLLFMLISNIYNANDKSKSAIINILACFVWEKGWVGSTELRWF